MLRAWEIKFPLKNVKNGKIGRDEEYKQTIITEDQTIRGNN